MFLDQCQYRQRQPNSNYSVWQYAKGGIFFKCCTDKKTLKEDACSFNVYENLCMCLESAYGSDEPVVTFIGFNLSAGNELLGVSVFGIVFG